MWRGRDRQPFLFVLQCCSLRCSVYFYECGLCVSVSVGARMQHSCCSTQQWPKPEHCSRLSLGMSLCGSASSLGYFLTVEKQDVRPEAQESCLGPILSLSSPGYDIVYDTSQWHVGESRGSARGFRRHSPRLPAYELKRKTGHAFKDSHQGHCGFGSEIGFRLHGGQSYVLGRCLPDHQSRIMSID